MYIYIYIYVYTHLSLSIYIYIYIYTRTHIMVLNDALDPHRSFGAKSARREKSRELAKYSIFSYLVHSY